MTEILSTVASGIAVVTVAVQLGENVEKLCDFWSSIKEAPEEIQAISLDLELLSSVLTQIAYEAQHVEPDATLVATLENTHYTPQRDRAGVCFNELARS